MKLEIGSKITWHSAAGFLAGTIKNIVLSENSAGETIPWIDVDMEYNDYERSSVRLCASVQGLAMLKVAPVDQ